jgi:hypothetical protein
MLVGGEMSTILGYVIPFATFILGILGYERVVKKDTEQYTKDMTILMTKVDMLLTQSTTMTADVKRHDEMLVKHDVKIQNIEDTLKFRRVTEND